MGLLTLLFAPPALNAQTKSVYEISFDKLDGGSTTLQPYKGKKILIVNTASKCGYTPQYKDLQALSERFPDQLVVIGFPSNNFMFQEPGNDKTIREFCTANYGVTFPMAAKIDVKGKKMHPLYVWLTQKRYNGVDDYSVKWNFQKFLLDEQGKLIGVFEPGLNPLDEKLLTMIEKK